jgi:hypothetical protein
MSLHAARLVTREVGKRAGVEAELVEHHTASATHRRYRSRHQGSRLLGYDGAGHALVIVAPEYNHGYSGLLKHVLDSCLQEYFHKAAGIVGVSAGPFGGARVIENMLPVMRELGLVTIFWDVNFSRSRKFSTRTARCWTKLLSVALDKFLKELIWMAKTMRHSREQIPLD